jgi:hypothetical protein
MTNPAGVFFKFGMGKLTFRKSVKAPKALPVDVSMLRPCPRIT